MTEYQVHPAAALFPMIEGEEYEALKADIKARGLDQPIVLWSAPDGRILLVDGRNRDKVCRELGMEPKTSYLPPGTDPLDYIISANIRRRHLTPPQCSALAVDLANMKLGDNQHRKEGCPNEQPSVSLSAAVEKVTGATLDTARRLAAVKKADPAVFEEVKTGKIKPGAAEKKVRLNAASEKHLNALKKKLAPSPGKTLPKAADSELAHHGDGSRSLEFMKLEKKLSPIFDALWLGLDPRGNAATIENALAELNIIPVSDRKRDPRKHLRELQAKAPKSRKASEHVAAAWLDLKDAWNKLNSAEQDAYVEVYFSKDDELMRALYAKCAALAKVKEAKTAA